jgi:hypothetical protein
MALNGRVLLLNQTYEPLGTVSVARAIIMTFKNTVFVEEFDGDRVLRSAHDEFPVPSVIRRRTYINVRRRRKQSGMKRLRIYMRDKFRCQYCGDKKGVAELTLDHILPRSRGGDYALSPKHQLAQYAATGCLNTTFYATADGQLAKVLELCADLDAEFIAKTAVFCRERGFMKDMPALLCAVLSVKDRELPCQGRIDFSGRGQTKLTLEPSIMLEQCR